MEEYLALKALSDKYMEENDGRFYIGRYPTQKTVHKLLQADFIGQKYNLTSELGIGHAIRPTHVRITSH